LDNGLIEIRIQKQSICQKYQKQVGRPVETYSEDEYEIVAIEEADFSDNFTVELE